MKTKRYLTVVAILLTSSLSVFAKNDDKIPGATVQDAAFFTGKPYDSDLGAYVFNYRNYYAEMGRWTTFDPSGFPDGANNFAYINNQTLNSCDPNGLTMIRLYMTGYESYEETWKEKLDLISIYLPSYGWVRTGESHTEFLEDDSTARASATLPTGASWDGDFITTSTDHYTITYSNQTPRDDGLPIAEDTRDADQFYKINWKRAYTIEE